MPEEKHIVLVLGMHRSGTSMIAEALASGGLHVASKLIAADPQINARGYWEDEELVAINEDLFASLQSSWFDLQPLAENFWKSPELDSLRERAKSHLHKEYGAAETAVIKDPRLSILLPFWLPLFAELGFNVSALIVSRHPLAIAASLARRDQLPQDYSLLLWLKYQRELAKYSSKFDSALIEYDAALQDLVGTINTALQSLPGNPPIKAIDLAIADVSLQHCKANSEAAGSIAKRVVDCYQQQLQGNNVDWESVSALDAEDYTQLLSNMAMDLVRSSGKQVEIGELHSYAQKIVQQRDLELSAANSSLKDQGKLLQHAENVVLERDQQLKEAATVLSEAREQRDEMERRLSGLYKRLQASIIGRLALRLIDRK